MVINIKWRYSNTTFVKVKSSFGLLPINSTSIQIQHLLKLNSELSYFCTIQCIIQIQHLLKLNSDTFVAHINKILIQIQHLLKLNSHHKKGGYKML